MIYRACKSSICRGGRQFGHISYYHTIVSWRGGGHEERLLLMLQTPFLRREVLGDSEIPELQVLVGCKV